MEAHRNWRADVAGGRIDAIRARLARQLAVVRIISVGLACLSFFGAVVDARFTLVFLGGVLLLHASYELGARLVVAVLVWRERRRQS